MHEILKQIDLVGCLEIGTVLTQKCGDDLCTIDGNTASITVDRILVISLKLKTGIESKSKEIAIRAGW